MKYYLLLMLMLFSGFLNKLSAQIAKEDRRTKQEKRKSFTNYATVFIDYDFKEGKYLNTLYRIKVHTPVVFRINNINPFAYHINVQSKDSVQAPTLIHEELIDFLKSSETHKNLLESNNERNESPKSQSFAAVEKEDVKSKGDVGKIVEGLNIIAQKDNLNEQIRAYRLEIKNINSEIINLNYEKSTLSGLDTINSVDTLRLDFDINEKKKRIGEIEDQITIYSAKVERLAVEINDELKEFARLNENFQVAYAKFVSDCQIVFTHLRQLQTIQYVASLPDLTYPIYESRYKEEFNTYRTGLKGNRDKVYAYKASYHEVKNAYTFFRYNSSIETVLNPGGVAKIFHYPEYLHDKLEKLYNAVNQTNLLSSIDDAIAVIEALALESTYTATSSPIQPVNDLVHFDIDIKRRNIMQMPALAKEKKFSYQQPLYGGTRLDLSIGLSASYFWNAPKYELSFDEASQQIFIYEQTNNTTSTSLLGLITVSKRKTGYCAWGISGGLGIDALNGKIQLSTFFGGPTAIIGRGERLMLTSGLSLRNVGQLKSGYKVGQAVLGTIDIENILSDYYKLGVFASLSYSLTKNAKLMIKKM